MIPIQIWKTIIQQRKEVLIVFDDVIAHMNVDETLRPFVTEFFLIGRKLNISLVLISKSCFKVPKTIKL